MVRTNGCLGLLALLISHACAQFISWEAHQVNTSICYWKQPRAAVIRNKVYLDGGTIWWMPGLESGQLGPVVNDGNSAGIILSFDFGESISPDTNTTGLLVKDKLYKARGGKENGISAEPNAYDGAMLANDAEFFLYGGALFSNDDLYEQPPGNSVLSYQEFQYGQEKSLWQKGFHPAHLDDGVTRYIAYGAAVSAPSENKAWYFSGLTSPTRGPILSNPGLNKTNRAMNVSDTLISLDMTTQVYEKWSNSTLPKEVKGRSNAEVVWVPVGKQGILVVLGGVTYPEWTSVAHKSENAAASEKESPEFMRVIDIYDIAGDKWYKQPTPGSPGTRSRGCAVAVPAADRSSFNIYYYGGFDGIHPTKSFYDDVWVLSLPSFTWTQINQGTELHARAGHKCFLPYPDQMMVFGGYAAEAGSAPSCLDKGPIVIFNTTSGEWMDTYDPAYYGEYGVHEKLRAVIGGGASGGATATAPVPSGWATSELGDVFAQKYDMSKIKTYWPYGAAGPTGRSELPADYGGGEGDKRHIIIPAVLVPVVFLLGASFMAWLLMRKRRARRNGSDESSSYEAASRIRSWIRGQTAEKSLSSSSSAVPSPSPHLAKHTPSLPSTSEVTPSPHHEMADTQVAELGDTSPPAELFDTGLTPVEVIQKHSSLSGHRAQSTSTRSQGTFPGLGDCTSFVSGSSEQASNAHVDSPLLAGAPHLPATPEFDMVHASSADRAVVSPFTLEEPIVDRPTPSAVSPAEEEKTRGAAGPLANEPASSAKDIFSDWDKDMTKRT
ncbi:hypothetical protein HIM_02583 [Hirsutella minnesotensis 3608]|nr:hypothetical protein HIM_02583 [Hirsutella minnesotensis 3608]